MPADNIQRFQPTLDTPSFWLTAVTPSDENDLEFFAHRVYCGGTGDLRIRTISDQDITLTNLAAGEFHSIACRRIYETGTTATGIVVGYIGD